MSLVKWLRKNNAKVMAVVVIVIMFGFVGGSYLTYLTRSGPRPRDTVAHYLDGVEITRLDLEQAGQELDILETLRADALLQSQDMQGLFLGEVLFAGRSDRGGSPEMVNYIRRVINENKYSISSKDIAGMYDRAGAPPTIYWLLLKGEAQRAGIRVSNADAGPLLGKLIPQLYQSFGTGITYQQVITNLMKNGHSEEKILTTFGDLLAVLQYANLICSNENVTVGQVKNLVSRQVETIDVDFVRVNAQFFSKTQAEPSEEKLAAHFDKYKAIEPATVTDDNPYGLGYKLPDMLRLEYIAIKLDDIAKIVETPTHEETESFYQKNKNLFTEKVSSDPNDPNAPKIDKIRGYAEVVDIIIEQLLTGKIRSRAKAVLGQAKTLTEPDLADTGLDLEKLTSKQFAEKARDYKDVVDKLSKEHNIKIYTGKTGLLSAVRLQMDKYLGMMSIDGFGYGPVNLTQVVFAVDEIAASELGPFTAAKPRLYENIGPIEDLYAARSRFSDAGEQLMAVVRIVEADKASPPESLDTTFSTHSLVLDPNEDKSDDDVFSVRKNVVEDIKKLDAMDTAKAKAQEFIDLAAKEGWQTAVDQFNKLYGADAKDDPNDPNVFKLDALNSLSRTSDAQLNTLAVQLQSSASAKYFLNEARVEGRFTDKLYSLVPPDANTPDKLPAIVEFKPNMSCFCIKKLQVKRLWKEDFENSKPVSFYRMDSSQYQSLAPIHLNPGNILKRMRFEFVEKEKNSPDANEPNEPEAAG
jgi:hypothetical protein